MAVQDPAFWSQLNSLDADNADDKGAVNFYALKQQPELQRQSAALLLAISLWSREPVMAGPALPPANAGTAPYGDADGESAYDNDYGSTLNPQPSTSGEAAHGGGDDGMRSPWTQQGSPMNGADAGNTFWVADSDDYPRHQEAIRRCRTRMKMARNQRDPFSGPTPHEGMGGGMLSPAGAARARLSARHWDPNLRTPGSPAMLRGQAPAGASGAVVGAGGSAANGGGANGGKGGKGGAGCSTAGGGKAAQQPTTGDDMLLGRRGDVEPGRPADLTSMRLLQEVLMFARKDGAKRLQSRNVDGVNGVLSLGHVGAVYVDPEGKPGELGVAYLPPPGRLGWRRFLKCACLDNGVALLSDTRGEVYFAGSFREHVPAPPRGRSSGALVSGQSSLAASPANDAVPVANPGADAATLKLLANNVSDIRGSRARIAALKGSEGLVHVLSPTAVRYPVAGGLNPFAPVLQFALGQGHDVFYIDANTRLLGKCAAGPKNATTPRKATTMLRRAVFTVSSGQSFVLAVDTCGCIWAQGRNEKGQLGVGSGDDVLRVFTPDQALHGRHFVVGVACGRQHAVAVTSAGFVFVTGDNRYGQLGLTAEEAEAAPHKAPSTVNRFTRLPMPGPCIGVACGTFSTFFVLRDGTVLGCGNNDFGQLGLMPPSSVVTPPQVVHAIAERGGLYGMAAHLVPEDARIAASSGGCCSGGCVVA
jgi:hypothetical protein